MQNAVCGKRHEEVSLETEFEVPYMLNQGVCILCCRSAGLFMVLKMN